MIELEIASSKVKVWRQRGRWVTTVDGVPVGGGHGSEAGAVGYALLHVMFARRRPGPVAAVSGDALE